MRRTLVLLGLIAVALGGCGESAPSDEKQIRDLLATFARATEKRDYQTLCDDVFAPKLLDGIKSIGLPCEVALRNSLGEVENPRLTVGAVAIKGAKASAEVRTSAKGQPPSSDSVELQKVDGKWRVSALAGSEEPAATPTATATASP